VKVLPSPAKKSFLVLELQDTRPGAEQQILKGALSRGDVREFSPVRPSLVDLFRDIVSIENEEAA
jgi:ABC-2 type transport system ATP-binding protein